MEKIHDEVELEKLSITKLIDFIALELSQNKIQYSKEIFDYIISEIKTNDFTDSELYRILENKLSHYSQNSLISFESADISNLTNIASSEISSDMKLELQRIVKYQDLSDIPDNVLRFGKNHASVIGRIFNLQITQNYLAALKWYIINDLVSQQNKFNFAISDSFSKILKLFIKTEIKLNEFQNYSTESTKWIQSNEFKLTELEKNIPDPQQTKEILTKLVELETYSTESTKGIQSNEFKLTELEKNIPDPQQTKEILTKLVELETYSTESTKWIQSNEFKLTELEKNIPDPQQTKEILTKLVELETYSTESTKGIQSNEFKLTELEKNIPDPQQTKEILTKLVELETYSTESTKGIQSNEFKLTELEKNIPDPQQTKEILTKLVELETYSTESAKWIKENSVKIQELQNTLADKLSISQIANENIFLPYNIALQRNPVQWEINMWSNLLKSGYPSTEILSILKNTIIYEKLKKDFLTSKGIVFHDNTTASKSIDKHIFYFNHNDPVLVEQFYDIKSYEKTTTSLLSKIVHKQMNILNIGANIGIFSILLSDLVGDDGKVFAFEPFPENINFLKRNIKENNCENLTVIPKAVSSKSGKSQLFLKESSTWHFLSSSKSSEFKSITVDTISVDDFLKHKSIKPDLIMMDAEGSELDIFDGMHETISKTSKISIICEYNPYALEQAGTDGTNFLEKISQLGFQINLIDEENKKIEKVSSDYILKTLKFPHYANLYLTKKV